MLYKNEGRIERHQRKCKEIAKRHDKEHANTADAAIITLFYRHLEHSSLSLLFFPVSFIVSHSFIPKENEETQRFTVGKQKPQKGSKSHKNKRRSSKPR
jgi:hypothetical protein